MATLTYSRPALFLSEQAGGSFPRRDISAQSGHTGTAVILPGDIVVETAVASGLIARAATNASALIYGYADVAETAVYGGTQTAWSQDAYDQQMFGYSQVGTILPANPGQVPTIPLGGGVSGPVFLDINVTSTTGWISGGAQQVGLGSTGGILLDATTNLFVFDPTQTNKVMTIYSKPSGPFQGGVGDLGARVRVYFNSGTV